MCKESHIGYSSLKRWRPPRVTMGHAKATSRRTLYAVPRLDSTLFARHFHQGFKQRLSQFQHYPVAIPVGHSTPPFGQFKLLPANPKAPPRTQSPDFTAQPRQHKALKGRHDSLRCTTLRCPRTIGMTHASTPTNLHLQYTLPRMPITRMRLR